MSTGQRGATSWSIYRQLEAEIVDRVRPPGTRLVEGALATELGTSRTPIREALRMLDRAGLVEHHANSKSVVREPRLDEVRNTFHLRGILEPEAAALAADAHGGGSVAAMQRIVDEGLDAVRAGEIGRLPALNMTFHLAVAAASGNDLLSRFVEELSLHTRWHFSAVAGNRGANSWVEHQAIVEAIAAGDRDRARDLSSKHCLRTRSAYIDQIFGPTEASS